MSGFTRPSDARPQRPACTRALPNPSVAIEARRTTPQRSAGQPRARSHIPKAFQPAPPRARSFAIPRARAKQTAQLLDTQMRFSCGFLRLYFRGLILVFDRHVLRARGTASISEAARASRRRELAAKLTEI